MISVDEAMDIIKTKITWVPSVKVKLEDAAFRCLAEDVTAPFDIPSFSQSAMDGYAFRFADLDIVKPELLVKGEIAAGETKQMVLADKQAVRIFTGAAVPTGADTVVMQEKTIVSGNCLVMDDALLGPGGNVRPIGSEIRSGTVALKAGTHLSPGAVGYLASIGVSEIKVRSVPRIHLIVTGSELQRPAEPYRYGKVYEANSYSLKAALEQCHFPLAQLHFVPDDLTCIKDVLAKALHKADLVLVTGGVSVGDYDFVREASGLCGVEQHFYGVKQKPGKPLFFGSKGRSAVFGLPGNPASVLTCFYTYVLCALERLSAKSIRQKSNQKYLTTSYRKKEGLTYFLKGYSHGGEVDILEAQQSFRLSSFAVANCLILLEEGIEYYSPGDFVHVYFINF